MVHLPGSPDVPDTRARTERSPIPNIHSRNVRSPHHLATTPMLGAESIILSDLPRSSRCFVPAQLAWMKIASEDPTIAFDNAKDVSETRFDRRPPIWHGTTDVDQGKACEPPDYKHVPERQDPCPAWFEGLLFYDSPIL